MIYECLQLAAQPISFSQFAPASFIQIKPANPLSSTESTKIHTMNTNQKTYCYLPNKEGLLFAASLASRAADTNENRGQFSAEDYKFAAAAARGGWLEVELGKTASQKASNTTVQKFGERMVVDHGKAGQTLQDIAAQNGATLPAEPSAEQQKQMDKLNGLSGADFDKEYVALMLKDHKADAKEFKRAAEDVQNPTLKAFAANTLPIVQDHLKMVQDIEQNLKHGTPMAP